MKRCVRLEAAAEAVCNQSAVPPLIFQLPPAQGSKILENLQNSPVYKYPADVTFAEIDTEGWGVIPVYFIVPQKSTAWLKSCNTLCHPGPSAVQKSYPAG